ncbi:MAG: PAS domain S-box protein, partial [Dehalococcoidia bacterium]
SPEIKNSPRYDEYLKVLETGEPCYAEVVSHHPQLGEKRHSVKAFKVGDGLGMIVSDITEPKRVEEVLLESEQKYRSLFDNMLIGFAHCQILLDEDNRPTDFVYLEVNDAFERLTGLKREAVLGKKVTEAIPGIKEAHPELFDIYGRVALTGMGEDFDIHLEPLDTWLSISVYCPKKGYFVAVFGNITERKIGEKELENIFNLSADMIAVCTTEGKFLRVSPAWKDVLGYTTDEILELGWARLVHPDDAGRTDNEVAQQLHGKPVMGFINRFRCKDGTYKTFEWRATPAEKGIVYATARDITERWQAEELQRKSTHDLGERVKELNCLYGVSALAENAEISTEEMLDGIVALLPPGWQYPEITCGRIIIWGQEFKTGNFADTEWIQASHVTVHGVVVGTVEVCYLEEKQELDEGPFLKEERNLINAVAEQVGKTIERRRAEEALKQYSERLEEMVEQRTKELRAAQEQLILKEKLATLGQLAGGVGHELRNPLGAIKNAVYFLNMVMEEPERDVKETLDILNREVATSERIISSLFDFGREKPPNQAKVDLNEVIQAVLSRFEIPGNVEVASQLGEDLPVILADPGQLNQVFLNIVLNAVQAMPGGGRLHIKSEESGPGWVAVSFTDTGAGMAAETLLRVFEPLFTTKAKGIGLGLAHSRTLVEGHSGTIGVQSELGRGSTFTVRLPTSRRTAIGGVEGGRPEGNDGEVDR